MDRDHLERALWAAAERRAAMHGVRLGQGADNDIRQFARTGADRIVGSDGEAVKASEAAFEKLIDEMVSVASEIPGYREAHPDTIGEDTLRWALSRLCPLFPIC